MSKTFAKFLLSSECPVEIINALDVPSSERCDIWKLHFSLAPMIFKVGLFYPSNFVILLMQARCCVFWGLILKLIYSILQLFSVNHSISDFPWYAGQQSHKGERDSYQSLILKENLPSCYQFKDQCACRISKLFPGENPFFGGAEVNKIVPWRKGTSVLYLTSKETGKEI